MIPELVNDLPEKIPVFYGIPACVGGDGILSIRNEGYLLRFYLEDKVDEFLDRISLDIEFFMDHRSKIAYILIPNMSLVRPWMHGNPLPAEGLDVPRYLHDIGYITSPAVPKGGYLVDVNAQLRHPVVNFNKNTKLDRQKSTLF